MESTTRVIRTVLPDLDGSVAIPRQFATELGIEPGTQVRITLDGDALVIRRASEDDLKGSPWLMELYDYFAPVRAEAEANGYTEEEINGWIDEAIAAVRAERWTREAETQP